MRPLRLTVSAIMISLLVVTGGMPSRAADSAASGTAQSDTRIRVVFFPFTGGATDTVRATGQTGLEAFIGRVNAANPLYLACALGPSAAVGATAPNCDAAQANVIVTTALRAADSGDATRVIGSVDLSGHRTLGSIQKSISSRADPQSASDEKTTAANLKTVLEQL